MPEWFGTLPSLAGLCLSSALRVDRQFFMEVFSGTAIMTLGVMMQCIPAICPWDVMYGQCFDIVQQEAAVSSLIEAGRVVAMHLGTPCQFFTLARTPQLRSLQHPGPFRAGFPFAAEWKQAHRYFMQIGMVVSFERWIF